jgi:hypothetical protein
MRPTGRPDSSYVEIVFVEDRLVDVLDAECRESLRVDSAHGVLAA